VTIGQETLDKAAANRHPDARAGRFVFLTVMDTGCGMSKELLAHIFDPFFTTKEVGKGTGLGLSTVLSIVQQHQGWVEVTSQPSHGSTFKVFLPVWEEAPVPVNIEAMPQEPERGGGETVLVVEDDASVRELSRVTLEQGGYRVLEAADGEQALEVWEQNRAAIVLLVTDVVMPKGLSGGALAQTLQDGNPALRVIYTSGYNPEFIKKDLPSTRDTVFIAKPYETQTLLKAVKQSLESVKDVQKQPSPKDSKFLASAI
jgi:CheY-like chemotaxis protein